MTKWYRLWHVKKKFLAANQRYKLILIQPTLKIVYEAEYIKETL